MAIVLFVLLWLTASNYPFGIFWSLCCLSFCDCQLLITHLVSFAIVLSVLLRLTVSEYPFGILCPLFCLSFCDWQLLITNLVSFGHCVVCPSVIHNFWLPIWYLVAIVLSVLLRLTASDYPFGILWPLCCLSCHWQLLVTHLVYCVHCVVCPSVVDSFWLPIWYLQAYHVNLVISENSCIVWFLGLLNFRIITELFSLKLNCSKMVFFEIELEQNCILWNWIPTKLYSLKYSCMDYSFIDNNAISTTRYIWLFEGLNRFEENKN